MVARNRDNNLSLDVKDIADLLEDKPNTTKLNDQDYDPLDHELIEDSGMRSASDPNLRPGKVVKPQLLETSNPTFESDTYESDS